MGITINWNPSPVEEVAQNVRTLLVTAPGTVPMARALGTPQDVLDAPVSAAGQRLRAAAIQAVKTYEPRVKVSRVDLAGDVEGRLSATVEIAPP